MPISYAQSNFREKQRINGHNPAKQTHKIWRKNFKGLLSYHILCGGSFFLAAPCTYMHTHALEVF